MAATKIPIELSSTPGIVDNSNATAITIDSNENVGIGTSSPNISSGASGSTVLTISATASARNGLIELKGTRLSSGDVVSYLRTFNNAGATPLTDIQSIRGASDTVGDLAFSTSNTERMRIDSSGNVGIGTSSPASGVGSPLTLTSTSTGYVGLRLNGTGLYANDWDLYASGDGAGLDLFGIFDRTNTTYRLVATNTGNVGIGTTSPAAKLDLDNGSSDCAIRFGSDTGDWTITNVRSSHALTITDSDGTGEVFRIDTSGNVLVGTTTASTSITNGFTVVGTTAVTSIGIGHVIGSGSGTTYAVFNYNGSAIGSITQNGTTAVLYNTSSDARLKEVTGSARGLEVINALNPVSYNWKADGKADEGLIAQEVLEIVPNAVSGSEEEYYQMDYSKLVTHLVAGMKEQQVLIEELKTRIETLENS